MKNPTDVSAVAAVPRLMVNEPAAGTTFSIHAVASLVLITANTMDDVVHRLLVTTNEVAAAAKLTVPDALLMVCAPVVPAAVLVAANDVFPLSSTFNNSTGVVF